MNVSPAFRSSGSLFYRKDPAVIKVIPKPNENIQSTLRRLRKICEKEGILKELRKRAYYEKPSDRKRRERRKTDRRQKQSIISKQRNKKEQKKNQG